MKAEDVTCGGKHHFMNLKDVCDKEKKKLIIFINGTLSQFLSAVNSGQCES